MTKRSSAVLIIVFALLVVLTVPSFTSQPLPPRPVLAENHPVNTMDVRPETWVATDGLGRSLSSYEDIGKKEGERFVGMFYWTWHDSHSKSTSPRNIQEILDSLSEEEALAAKNDYNHKVWKRITGYHFWNEPIFGYYSTVDKYVLRKHAEMLADAGVDVVIFDNTNGSFLWKESYTAVMETFAQARQEGVNTPSISFILNFGPEETTAEMLVNIYNDIFKQKKHEDLWFYWEGKPLIMAHEKALDLSLPLHKEINDFFTFRNNDGPYFTKTENAGKKAWGWLSVYPQCEYGKDEDGHVEQMAVGVAQNATETKLTAMNGDNVLGRSYAADGFFYSYTYMGKEIKVTSDIENSKLYGLNFQQQWDYAISKDPDFIFVTGWNEWVAMRHDEWLGTVNAFPDQYNDEYSRDIEPSKGDLKDHYYYQLVENVRRYKGLNVPEEIKDPKTIDIFGDLSQWDDVASYNHYTNNTWERDNVGYRTTRYTNHTMRNDIVKAKATYDDDNIYFYVETLEDLTDSSDPAWMRLFIDTQEATQGSKHWEEMEYLVNRISPSENVAYLERSTGGWNWEQVAELRYSINGNVLQIEIPRKDLDLAGTKAPNFNFKWADNMQEDGDILDFYQNGDVAPGGRFMFAFRGEATSKEEVKKMIGTEYIVLIAVVALAIVAIAVTLIITSKKRKA